SRTPRPRRRGRDGLPPPAPGRCHRRGSGSRGGPWARLYPRDRRADGRRPRGSSPAATALVAGAAGYHPVPGSIPPDGPAHPSRSAPRVKIEEADAKSLLVAQGLPVPPWEVAHTAAEAREAAERFFAAGAQQVVIKAQVLVGGRGKAGGVKLAGFPEQAELVA